MSILLETEFNRPPREGGDKRISRIKWHNPFDPDGLHIRTFTGNEEGGIETIKENDLRVSKEGEEILVSARLSTFNPETGRLIFGVSELRNPKTGQLIIRK